MKSFRKIAMEETKKAIAGELENIPNIEDYNLHYIVLSFLKKKINSDSIRSFFVKHVYLYIVELAKKENYRLRKLNKKHFLVHLPFIAEMTMAILYLDNHSLDKKYDTKQQIDFSNNQFASYSLRKMLRDYVKKTFSKNNTPIILDTLSQIFECVNMGQFLDKNYNNYDGYKNNIGFQGTYPEIDELIGFGAAENIIQDLKSTYPKKAEYLHLYFTRIFLTTASTFLLFTRLITDLLGYDGKHRNDILDFAKTFGILSQIVNDITDVVKHKDGTTSKSKNDTLSDLKNQTISLPLILHLNNCDDNSLIKEYLEIKNLEILKEKEEEILDELINSEALDKTIKIGKLLSSSRGYRNKIRGDVEVGKYLTDLSSVAFNNRFYQEIFRRKKLNKRSSRLTSQTLKENTSKNENKNENRFLLKM